MTASAAVTNTLYVPGSTYGSDFGGTAFREATHLPGHPVVLARGDIRCYAGLIPMLLDRFGKLGYVPEIAVIAIAGNWRDGRWDFTNLPAWETVTEQEVLAATGVRIMRFINDMQAAKVGATIVPRDRLVLLKDGAPQPGRSIAALTASTGNNFNSGEPDASLSMHREAGHVRVPVPIDFSDVMYLVADASRDHHATVEDLIAGQRGPAMIAHYVATSSQPPRNVLKQLDNTPPKEVGKLMTYGVMDHVPFWTRVGRLYADVLGYVLNSVIVGDLVGELIVQGSVIMGTPGFAQWMFNPKNTSLLDNLISTGLPKSYVAEDCTVWGAPDDANMATLGAERIARSFLS